MDNSYLYDRKLFKEELIKIYNKNKYNFQMNGNMLFNLINNWRKTSNRFTKFCLFNNKFD